MTTFLFKWYSTVHYNIENQGRHNKAKQGLKLQCEQNKTCQIQSGWYQAKVNKETESVNSIKNNN